MTPPEKDEVSIVYKDVNLDEVSRSVLFEMNREFDKEEKRIEKLELNFKSLLTQMEVSNKKLEEECSEEAKTTKSILFEMI